MNWVSPGLLFVKLNVDGSLLGNPGYFGKGFAVCNNHGLLVMAQCIYLGVITSIGAEIKSMLCGLKECHCLRLHHVQVETDSQVLVRMIQQQIDWPWRFVVELKKISDFFTTNHH